MPIDEGYTLQARCDECGNHHYHGGTMSHTGKGRKQVRDKLRSLGWTFRFEDNIAYCPKCTKEGKADE